MAKIIIVSGQGSKTLCEELAKGRRLFTVEKEAEDATDYFTPTSLNLLIMKTRFEEKYEGDIVIDLNHVPALGGLYKYTLTLDNPCEFIELDKFKWSAVDSGGFYSLFVNKPRQSMFEWMSEYKRLNTNEKVKCKDWKKSLKEL